MVRWYVIFVFSVLCDIITDIHFICLHCGETVGSQT